MNFLFYTSVFTKKRKICSPITVTMNLKHFNLTYKLLWLIFSSLHCPVTEYYQFKSLKLFLFNEMLGLNQQSITVIRSLRTYRTENSLVGTAKQFCLIKLYQELCICYFNIIHENNVLHVLSRNMETNILGQRSGRKRD